ncbi:hypothetical protein [Baaleninema sp.]|uniref:hypothetical protein n=1 Tax=Baaleninema sp. TaxID=3101197 RepID=UPI003D083EB1
MTQAQALQLAKRGNPTAIATLMNHQLQWQHIQVAASRQGCCLYVELEAKGSLPDRNSLVQWVRSGLVNLNPRSISQVRVLGKQQGSIDPLWEEAFEFPLVQSHTHTLAAIETRMKTLVSSSLWEEAKRGNPEAIAQLLEVAVWQNELHVATIVEKHQLQVVLEAEALPDEVMAVTAIVKMLRNLDIPWLTSAVVFGKSRRNSAAMWKRVLDRELDPQVTLKNSIASIVNFYESSVNPQIRR